MSVPSRLVEDTAWHPVMPTEMDKWNPTARALFKLFLGSPLKLWASIGHWWIWHFDLSKYTEKQKPRVGGRGEDPGVVGPAPWRMQQRQCRQQQGQWGRSRGQGPPGSTGWGFGPASGRMQQQQQQWLHQILRAMSPPFARLM